MKKIYLFTVVFLLVVSCNKDKLNIEAPSDDVNSAEQVALNPDDVSDGILIENAINKTGNAPSPSGTIAFNLDETTESAFQKNGFDITFNAPDNYAGAYIQLKYEDGTMAKDYWDAPKVVNVFSKSANTKNKGVFVQKRNKLNQDQEILIDIDFEDSVPAGTFCYFICIYDTNGNISQPTEVCVEVESWGGNSNIVGTWNFVKEVDNDETITVGTMDCEDSTVYCNNNNTNLVVENAYCWTIVSIPLTFNEDGTYSYTSNAKSRDIDYQLSQENCEAFFEEEKEDKYFSKGKWAYDEEEEILTLVEFEYRETYNDMTESVTRENGELLYNGKTSVSSNDLIISLDGELDGDGTVYEYKIYFGK